MAPNLRQLFIQRAARLQGRPALTAPSWETLSWGAWRNRVEGVALGVMAMEPPPTALFSRTGSPWDWTLEVAAACAGIPWDASAPALDPAILGGPRFNDENGRPAYHDREDHLDAATPFEGPLSQGDLLRKFQRWNGLLGWDHDTVLKLPLSVLDTPPARAALWNALYAGAHTILLEETKDEPPTTGLFARFRKAPPPAWNPSAFDGFWD
ncbi:MAG: hypothetical protein JST05_07735 [Acidobacteria bacterium]|nr:hypothetical protein [Acidobacteriota bacterium]